MAKAMGQPWTDDELEAAVYGYMFLLKLQRTHIEYPLSEFYSTILSGPLRTRNEAAVRYRLRNISHVLSGREFPTLDAFSPAAQVGSGVEKRLSAILDQYLAKAPEFSSYQLTTIPPTEEVARSQLISMVQQVQRDIEALSPQNTRGHNNPPSLIGQSESDLIPIMQDLSDRLKTIEQSLAVTSQEEQLNKESYDLASATLRLFSWIGQRFTKFVDATLVVAAPIVFIKLTGTISVLLDIVSKLQNVSG